MNGEYDGSHKYQVVFVDEYDNWWLCGFYDKLSDSLEQVNSYLSQYKANPDQDSDDESEESMVTPWVGENSPFGDLAEQAGTFGPTFCIQIHVPEGCVQVRGFTLL